MASKKRTSVRGLDIRLDSVVFALVSEVDYDQAKNLDENTAEEPDEVIPWRRRLRAVLLAALKEEGLLAKSSETRTK